MPQKMQPLARTPVGISESPLALPEDIRLLYISSELLTRNIARFSSDADNRLREWEIGWTCQLVLDGLIRRIELRQLFEPPPVDTSLARIGMPYQNFVPVEDVLSRMRREFRESHNFGQYFFAGNPFRYAPPPEAYRHDSAPRAQTNAEKLAEWGYLGEISSEFLCYVTGEIMTDPVVVYPQIPLGYGEASDARVAFAEGITLDRSALTEWRRHNSTDPRTRAPINHDAQVIANVALAARIEAFMDSINPENPANRSMVIR